MGTQRVKKDCLLVQALLSDLEDRGLERLQSLGADNEPRCKVELIPDELSEKDFHGIFKGSRTQYVIIADGAASKSRSYLFRGEPEECECMVCRCATSMYLAFMSSVNHDRK